MTRGEELAGLLEIKLHYFVLVAAGSLILFVFASVCFSLSCIVICRRRMKKKSEEKEEKKKKEVNQEDKFPDILSDLGQRSPYKLGTINSSCFSLDTTTTPASISSSRMAVLQPSELYKQLYTPTPNYPSDYGLPKV